MAVVITLLNSRESSMPYTRSNSEGDLILSRQYSATIQVLVEGTVRDCLNWNASIPGGSVGAVSSITSLGSIPNIQIDDENDFSPSVDLHPNPLVAANLIITMTEVVWNYDKVSQNGKMVGTYQYDINGPIEVFEQDESGVGEFVLSNPLEF